MATASRSRQPAGTRPRARSASVRARLPLDVVRAWIVPSIAGAVAVASIALGSTGLLATDVAVGSTIFAALVLLLYVGEHPLVTGAHPAQARALGAGLALVWLAACYLPFHARIFPGTPLVDGAELTADGHGLPLRIPAAGHAAIDLLLEGHLEQSPTGGVAPPVHYTLTLAGDDGATRVVDGTFEDTLRTRRLGRRGTAVVHQSHTADVRVLPNPGSGDVTVTQLVLEPASAHPIALSAFAHPLPGMLVLGLATAVLLGAVVAFDRLGPIPETDGALTLATTAVVGTAIIFWTSNAVHPDFQTLIGSAIFGGPLGFAAGALVWWVAKHLIVPAAR